MGWSARPFQHYMAAWHPIYRRFFFNQGKHYLLSLLYAFSGAFIILVLSHDEVLFNGKRLVLSEIAGECLQEVRQFNGFLKIYMAGMFGQPPGEKKALLFYIMVANSGPMAAHEP